MRKFILITGILVALPLVLAGQSKTEDVIYLKNGSILRGEIVEQVENEFIRIEISGGNVFLIDFNEVEEIKSESKKTSTYYKESGYMNRSGLDVLQATNSSSPRFYMVNGYQFTPKFSAGFGIGFTPYNDPLTLIPFFVDFNFRLLEANYSPFFFLKAGYNFSVHHDEDFIIDEHRGGLLFNPGIGLQFNLSSGLGWYLNAGYNIDNSSYEFDWWGNQTVENDHSFRRVNFGIGLSF